MNIKKMDSSCSRFVLCLYDRYSELSVYIYPPQGVLIFEYHRVNDDSVDTDDYSLSRQQFHEQLDYFKDNGYNTISLMDVYSR